jgi:hypothetical protein
MFFIIAAFFHANKRFLPIFQESMEARSPPLTA